MEGLILEKAPEIECSIGNDVFDSILTAKPGCSRYDIYFICAADSAQSGLFQTK